MFLFYPLLSSGLVGYPMTWKTTLFMTWAGLRGRVSADRLYNRLGMSFLSLKAIGVSCMYAGWKGLPMRRTLL